MGTHIELGYSTYALQDIDPFEALQRIREIGYDAIEIAVGDDWSTAPQKLDAANRRELRKRVEDLGFPPPSLFGPVPTCAEGLAREEMLEQFTEILDLAGDLNFGSEPAVVTSTVGGRQLAWAADRMRITDDLVELAELAAGANTILAVEPHVGGAFDTPEKAAWLMQQTQHKHLRLNFDHSHFHVQGMDLQHCVDLCLPSAVHVHIKDGTMAGGKVTFLLPGEGSLDLTVFVQAVSQGGIAVPVTAEVSAMIWREPGYDPWPVAESCYVALDRAREAALS
jgi:sugar phosphate isomerase/epimerase